MSRRPNADSVLSIRGSAADGSARSATNAAVGLPLDAAIASMVAVGSAVLAWSARLAPAFASDTAIAAPSPREAPVTSATLPSSRNRSVIGAVPAYSHGPHRALIPSRQIPDVR